MNANPFTLGHLYLTERASAENDTVHLFMVSEDASLIPFKVRRRLITEGTSHLDNIIYHDSGPYIISSATVPSYFQKDMDAVIESHAKLDLVIFTKIAHALGIGRRYVGEEPHSRATGIYNQIMEKSCQKPESNAASSPAGSRMALPSALPRSAGPLLKPYGASSLPCSSVHSSLPAKQGGCSCPS